MEPEHNKNRQQSWYKHRHQHVPSCVQVHEGRCSGQRLKLAWKNRGCCVVPGRQGRLDIVVRRWGGGRQQQTPDSQMLWEQRGKLWLITFCLFLLCKDSYWLSVWRILPSSSSWPNWVEQKKEDGRCVGIVSGLLPAELGRLVLGSCDSVVQTLTRWESIMDGPQWVLPPSGVAPLFVDEHSHTRSPSHWASVSDTWCESLSETSPWILS